MERFYEVMFILRPDLAEEDADKIVAGLEQTIANGGGTLRSVEKMGRRKLAYLVRKFNEGNYILLTVDADGPLVAELERRLRVTEQVIKFITVRMDEEEKRVNKIKAIRASRVKASDQPTAVAVEAEVAAPVAAPPVPEPVLAEPVVEVPSAETSA